MTHFETHIDGPTAVDLEGAILCAGDCNRVVSGSRYCADCRSDTDMVLTHD